MTRSLHVLLIREGPGTAVFVSEQGKHELLIWRDNLVFLNHAPFWPTKFVPSKVVFWDASLTAGCGTFVQDFDLVHQWNWSIEKSQKFATWRELVVFKFIQSFWKSFSRLSVRRNSDNQNVVRIIQVDSMTLRNYRILLSVLFWL